MNLSEDAYPIFLDEISSRFYNLLFLFNIEMRN